MKNNNFEEEGEEVLDSNGAVLADGDTVIIIKDLKVKGAGGKGLKKGAKIKNIRLDVGEVESVLGNSDTIKGLSIRPEYVKKA